MALYAAWHAEAFARVKKLPRLSAIIGEKPKAQTPEEMFEVLKQFQARGAPMTITEIN